MRAGEKIIEEQTNLIGVFLNEFCKVNDIKESELKNNLKVVSYPTDLSIMVVNVDDIRDVKFGVKGRVKTEKGSFLTYFDLFGEYLDYQDKYPETTKFIEHLENEGNTGDTNTPS